jgi:hypothetical protein
VRSGLPLAAAVVAVAGCTFQPGSATNAPRDDASVSTVDAPTRGDARTTPPVDAAADAPKALPLDCLDAQQHGENELAGIANPGGAIYLRRKSS